MTKKEWLSLPLQETPLVSNKKYRGGEVKWSNGVKAYFTVAYRF
jgi:hypothetical protein